ncbi:MAG: glycosyltransferase [Candidatus Methanomethyliaceae archaeon]
MKVVIGTYWPLGGHIVVGDHHYARLLAKMGIDTMVISHVRSPLHIIWKMEGFNINFRVRSLGRHLYSFTPFSLVPLTDRFELCNRLLGKLSLRLTIPRLRKGLERSGFEQVNVLWISNFALYPLIRELHYDKLVARITDDPTGWHRQSRTINEWANETISKSDYVFTTAYSLWLRYNRLRDNVIYVPNGVDYDHFALRPQPIPVEYQGKIKSPRVVYVGAIDWWFDEDLVRKVAEQLPDVNFVLIGPVRVKLRLLKRLDNVFFLGPKSYDLIPKYLAHSDLGIIPFKDNQLVRSVSPIKMLEYLAAGLPVVSSPMPEAERINPPVVFAEDAAGFLEGVRHLIYNKPDSQYLKAFAQTHSWENRLKIICQYLFSEVR